MHILALIIGTVVGVLFWLNRASGGAREVADAATTLANLPRRRRHAKAVNRRGLDLVETPVEAATILMLSISRMSEDRRLSDEERAAIERQLIRNMQLDREDANGMVLQMDIVQSDVTLPESALFPMVDLLRDQIDKDDARLLAEMMGEVADVHGRTAEQTEFIRRYRERMGLL